MPRFTLLDIFTSHHLILLNEGLLFFFFLNLFFIKLEFPSIPVIPPFFPWSLVQPCFYFILPFYVFQSYLRCSLMLDGSLSCCPSAALQVETDCPLFEGLQADQKVLLTHGDSVATLADGLACVARSTRGLVAAVANVERRLYGIQFHPEVDLTVNGAFSPNLLSFLPTRRWCFSSSTLVDERVEANFSLQTNGEHLFLHGSNWWLVWWFSVVPFFFQEMAVRLRFFPVRLCR